MSSAAAAGGGGGMEMERRQWTIGSGDNVIHILNIGPGNLNGTVTSIYNNNIEVSNAVEIDADSSLPNQDITEVLRSMERGVTLARNLQRITLEERGSDCSICLQEFATGSTAVRLSHCPHIFHEDCITRWLNRRNTCPLCRRTI